MLIKKSITVRSTYGLHASSNPVPSFYTVDNEQFLNAGERTIKI
jgi:hypothetical protein